MNINQKFSMALTVGLFCGLSGAAHAGITFYSSRSAFDLAEPGLPVEGFENANVNPGQYLLAGNVVDSTTNNSIFSTGSILSGIQVTHQTTADKPGLIVYGAGAIFGASKCIGTNWFGDALVLNFASGVAAVGTDVFAATSPGQTLAGDFTMDIYNGTTFLGESQFSEAKGQFGFTGVSSTTPITSAVLLYTTDDATTFVDNVAFGTNAVPEPSSLAVFGLMGLTLFKKRRSR